MPTLSTVGWYLGLRVQTEEKGFLAKLGTPVVIPIGMFKIYKNPVLGLSEGVSINKSSVAENNCFLKAIIIWISPMLFNLFPHSRNMIVSKFALVWTCPSMGVHIQMQPCMSHRGNTLLNRTLVKNFSQKMNSC